MEGPGRARPQGNMVCQFVKDQDQGTHFPFAIDLMCDLGQTMFPL